MTPRDREVLERVVECVDAVDACVSRVGADWVDDGMAVDAIVKCIEEIEEIAMRLEPEVPASMPSVDWTGVKGIRTFIAHEYEQVDVELLADVVRECLRTMCVPRNTGGSKTASGPHRSRRRAW